MIESHDMQQGRRARMAQVRARRPFVSTSRRATVGDAHRRTVEPAVEPAVEPHDGDGDGNDGEPFEPTVLEDTDDATEAEAETAEVQDEPEPERGPEPDAEDDGVNDTEQSVEEDDGQLTVLPYHENTTAKLRELLELRGLPVSGNKAALVKRLEDHDAERG